MSQPAEETAEPTVYELDSERAHIAPEILLLEDDARLAEMLAEFLHGLGYRLTSVSNGVDGVKQIMAADFDVILCDLLMPNLPGDMFYLAVQRAKPKLCQRFIFMTGKTNDAKLAALCQMEGCAVLWKPFRFEEMLAKIEGVLKRAA